jgi:hypothetical protein
LTFWSGTPIIVVAFIDHPCLGVFGKRSRSERQAEHEVKETDDVIPIGGPK